MSKKINLYVEYFKRKIKELRGKENFLALLTNLIE